MITRPFLTSIESVRVLCFFMAFIATGTVSAKTNNLQLPSMGENSAGLISPSQEYELGQELIRLYKANMPLSDDPFLEDYLEQLLRRIALYSELPNKKLELLVIDNPSLNAFAAPGGIVGVNTGTFMAAQNEHQLASILAHELAHLSQRHYARRLQQQKTTSTLGIAALLGSLVAVASGNTDAGMAAIPAIQAASIEASLRFSRDMETEADRMGMLTLVNAGFDPNAMPSMFEEMLKATRFRTKVPEFLLTHPITEHRIADSATRAQQYAKQVTIKDDDYQLMRARVLLRHESRTTLADKHFADEIGHFQSMSPLTAYYGWIMALTNKGDTVKANELLPKLKSLTQNREVLAVLEADIAAKEQRWPDALNRLESSLKETPHSHPITIRLAEMYMESGRNTLCEALLEEHVKIYPTHAYVWYLLAESHGLAGHIFEVHKARAEYFILKGIYDRAEIQLRNALKLADAKDFQQRAKLEQRLLDVKKLQESRQFK